MIALWYWLQENWKAVVEAVSAVTVAVCAVCALYTWRKEFVGKKKIEFAAEFMEKAIEIKDLISFVRNGWAAEAEKKEIEKKLKKEGCFYESAKLSYLVPKWRLLQNDSKIMTFSNLRTKASMYFGEDALKIFYLINKIILHINFEAEILFKDSDFLSKKIKQEYQKTIWASFDDEDKIALEFDKVVNELKSNLEPIYRDKKFKWKK